MRIVSWNVNSVRARIERVVTYVEREQPDVLCIQESKVVDQDFPREPFEALGYHLELFGQPTYNGVALLSRLPLTDVVRGIPGLDDTQARFIGAKVADFRLFNAYVPNGQEIGSEAFEYKLRWLEALREYLATHVEAREKVLICGDWNVALEDRDVHDPDLWRGKLHCSEPERASIGRLIEMGLADLFRRFHEDAGLFSWWDYRRLGFQKNKGLRIDYFLGSPELVERCEGVAINREERKGEKPSDHAPVEATFRD